MKTVKDFNFNNQTVILRCDLNVPIKDGKIIDDTKIKASLKTLNYLLEQNAKVIIMSHLGRIKTKEDKEKNDMRIVYKRLKKLTDKTINFVDTTNPSQIARASKIVKYGEALLIQNTRFQDIRGNKESGCDKKLSKNWSKLGTIFINDALATIHRKHASNYGLASNMKSGVGFLIEEELENLNKLDNPKRPYTVIMGGSKVSDKIGIIKSLIRQADYIIIGGAMAFTFLKAKGYDVGKSLYEKEELTYCKYLLRHYPDRIILPEDFYGSTEFDNNSPKLLQKINEIDKNFIGMDIGEESIKKFKTIIKESNTIFWNGPLGVYEYENYRHGTEEILKAIKNKKLTIIGGGDIVGCANLLGLTDDLTFISTGGGATLKYLENHHQPGLLNME